MSYILWCRRLLPKYMSKKSGKISRLWKTHENQWKITYKMSSILCRRRLFCKKVMKNHEQLWKIWKIMNNVIYSLPQAPFWQKSNEKNMKIIGKIWQIMNIVLKMSSILCRRRLFAKQLMKKTWKITDKYRKYGKSRINIIYSLPQAPFYQKIMKKHEK